MVAKKRRLSRQGRENIRRGAILRWKRFRQARKAKARKTLRKKR